MAGLTVNFNVPSPDDATNGVQPGVSITVTRGTAVVVSVVNPNDPSGPWDVPIAQALTIAADRTAFRDLMLKILQSFKTARGYV